MDWETFWIDAWPWVWPSIALIAWLVVGGLMISWLLRVLMRRAEKTVNEYDDAFVPRLKRPLFLALVASGLGLWAKFAPIDADINDVVALLTKTVIALIIVLVVDAAIQTWMRVREKTSTVLQTSGGVLRAFARIVVYTVGGLTVLATIGLDVTPFIASLGVGSLAVGLALQSTLQDFISGLLIAADQPVRVGEFIEIEGLAGTVTNIGWRSARIRTRDAMVVIVPNTQLVNSKLINRSRPNDHVEFKTTVGVGYGSDLPKVGRVLAEVASTVHSTHPDAVAEYRPSVVAQGFGASSVDFYIWCQARHWLRHQALLDAMVQAIHARFAAEGITIPFPIRTLDVPPTSPLLSLARQSASRPPADP